MAFTAEFIPYDRTGYFSKIVTDYLSGNDLIQSFYQHQPTIQGIKNSIVSRKNFNTNRKLIVEQLQKQYSGIETSEAVKNNISALSHENTFTVCTAHQPNIFTGHLYFIYKILHVIKFAATLNQQIPENKFVPVFYMGSEDADLTELGEVYINGETSKWATKQTGAVGRMLVDDELLQIIKKIKGQISVEPFGEEIIKLIEDCYVKGQTLQNACFHLINKMFSNYGLLVLLPDNGELKKQMTTIFHDDIFPNIPSESVNATTEQLSKNYPIQAHPRQINLFYLKDDIRERISFEQGHYKVLNTKIAFTKDELITELNSFPERFSPNVILRALYQETILPNVAFIGGGGEIAYWLEFKDLFQHYKVPYPVLLLRNSFLIIDSKIDVLLKKFAFTPNEIFKSNIEIINKVVATKTTHQLSLDKQKQEIILIYAEIKKAAGEIDLTLTKHVEALQSQLLNKLEKLEKKFHKAEKRNFEAEQNQINKIRSALFPGNALQERVENFMPFYARWGKNLLEILNENSKTIEQQFCLISEHKK